jgi:hypothetical protein
MEKNPRVALDTFAWEPRPHAELARLTKLLQQHLSKHGVPARERTYAKAGGFCSRFFKDYKLPASSRAETIVTAGTIQRTAGSRTQA